MKLKRLAALLVVLALLLAGCGAAPDDATLDALTNKVGSHRPKPAPSSDFAAWGCGDQTLEDYYAYAGVIDPAALAGVAYVGDLLGPSEKNMVWADIQTDGIYSFMLDIDPDNWQCSCTGGPISVWCIAPASKDYTLTVYEQLGDEPNQPEKGELLYQAEPGEPVLFLVDLGACPAPFCAEVEAPDGRSTLLSPEMDYQTEIFQPFLPEDGAAFDLTVRKGQGVIRDLDLYGEWHRPAQILDRKGEITYVNQFLTFMPEGEVVLERQLAEDSSLLTQYKGSWERVAPDLFSLDLRLKKGTPIEDENGRGRKRLTGICLIQEGLDGTLILTEEAGPGVRGTTFYRTGYAGLTPLYTYEWDNFTPLAAQVKSILLDYLASTTDMEYPADWGVLLRRATPDDWLFEVYHDGGTCAEPSDWYMVNPYTLDCADLYSQEAIDLYESVEPLEQIEMVLDGCITYYNQNRLGDDQPPADFARLIDSEDSMVLINVYSSARSNQEYRANYVVDLDTGASYDPDDYEPEFFYISEELADPWNSYYEGIRYDPAGSDFPDEPYFPDEPDFPGEPDTDLLMDLALDWCESTTGYRPSAAMVEPDEDGMVSIRVYDDMGDHIATCGIYVVDPVTLMGYDAIMGNEVDFNAGAVG